MTTVDPLRNLARKVECEEDGLYNARYFFKQRMNTKMIVSDHHAVVQQALDRTMLPPDHPDFIPRLIVNLPPGYTKTELCTINYMTRGIAKNPMARFLHLSYSDNLVLLNSSIVRENVKSSAFRDMWPVGIKSDTDSKKIWYTTANGGITATAAGGQVTGFRAGHMGFNHFTGALIVDDPVKPADAHSESIREQVNTNYNETIASRVAVETVPIIVVMQRIHYSDLSGYLLRGGSGEKWHHLELPVWIDSDRTYNKEYTHGIPIDHGLPNGWLWSYKHNDLHDTALRSHRRKFSAQYMQSPPKQDSTISLWTEAMISRARSTDYPDGLSRTLVSIDPATTDTKTSDEHGILVGSKYGPNQYSLDADYSRKGSPLSWAQAAIAAYKYHDADAILIETNQGGDMCESNLRNAGFKGRVLRVHATKGKRLRAEPVVSLYELGYVAHGTGLSLCEDEMLDFDPITQKSGGKSPNRVDAAVHLLTELAGLGTDMGDLLDMALGAN